MEYELQTQYDSRKSFYGKAKVEVKDGVHYLYSYDTLVAEYNEKTGEVDVKGWYSATTARHINEFLQQLGFDKMTKTKMEA